MVRLSTSWQCKWMGKLKSFEKMVVEKLSICKINELRLVPHILYKKLEMGHRTKYNK